MDTKYGSALKTRLRIRSGHMGLEMATLMHLAVLSGGWVHNRQVHIHLGMTGDARRA